MKDELAVYEYKRQKLKTPQDGEDDGLEDVDPELKAAILKMRRLDRILKKKIKREKEVKRERILLQRR